MLARIISEEDLMRAIKCEHTTIVRTDYFNDKGYVEMSFNLRKNEFKTLEMYGTTYTYTEVLENQDQMFRIYFSHPLDDMWSIISKVDLFKRKLRKDENPCYAYLNNSDAVNVSVYDVEERVNDLKNLIREIYGPITCDEYAIRELHQILENVK